MTQIAELFNASQDEIEVKVTVPSNYNEAVIVRVAGGAAPDAADHVNRYGDFAGRNMLFAMDSFLAKSGLERRFVPATFGARSLGRAIGSASSVRSTGSNLLQHMAL